MNTIMLIALFAIAYFLGVASEEVEGKSKVAYVILLVLWAGELISLSYILVWFPMTILSWSIYIAATLFMTTIFHIGTLITTLKHRISELEEKKCPS